ncbi:PqiC family protein [Marinobacterium arenosum]|uniref:PqiC family protein n=1 Tax=Marinobacterium arenosum TaxID=2862496 RepID=UPI001C9573DF|nr:PqiC family protein [Marinobacterium arenosum]MBY4675317.1 PqiC family protein [Marinobacterium arenosum]
MKTLASLCLLLLLGGCAATATPPTHYYTLNDADHAGPRLLAEQTLAVIGIAPVGVADYIDNEGLALLTASHQLHLARQHRWAEPPSQAIGRALQIDLGEQLPVFRIDNSRDGTLDGWDYRLRLRVDQFHGTANGEAVLAGNWRLEDPTDNRVLSSQRFRLSQPLTERGYPALVIQLRALLRQLAGQLAAEISQQAR